MKHKFLLSTIALAFLAGNIYKLPGFTPELRISALDTLVVILTLGAWIFKRQSLITVLKSNAPLSKSIVFFFLIGIVSLVLAISHFGVPNVLAGSAYLGRWLFYSVSFASLVVLLEHSSLKKLILILGLGTAILGLVQYLVFPDIRPLAAIANWDDHYFRVVGTFLDPGFTGLILVFTLLWLTLEPIKNRGLQAVSWTLSYLAFALTYSRSAYLAYLVAMTYIAFKKRSWKFLVGILVLFVFTVYALPRAPDGEGVKLERTSSIQARIENWKHALTIAQDNPLIGVGFNTYRYAQRDYGFLTSSKWQTSHAGSGSDSSLLLVLATTGGIGLAAYLWFGWNVFKLSGQSEVFQASLVALFLHSFFLNSLFYPAVMLWMGILLALTVSKRQ